jgi:hypothetical protein
MGGVPEVHLIHPRQPGLPHTNKHVTTKDPCPSLPRFAATFSTSSAREVEHHHHPLTMLRPSLVPRIGASCRIFRRSLHNVPRLTHDFASDGVPGLLGPAGFDISWTQYQSVMVERLNRLTVGTLTALIPWSHPSIYHEIRGQDLPRNRRVDTSNPAII